MRFLSPPALAVAGLWLAAAFVLAAAWSVATSLCRRIQVRIAIARRPVSIPAAPKPLAPMPLPSRAAVKAAAEQERRRTEGPSQADIENVIVAATRACREYANRTP